MKTILSFITLCIVAHASAQNYQIKYIREEVFLKNFQADSLERESGAFGFPDDFPKEDVKLLLHEIYDSLYTHIDTDLKQGGLDDASEGSNGGIFTPVYLTLFVDPVTRMILDEEMGVYFTFDSKMSGNLFYIISGKHEGHFTFHLMAHGKDGEQHEFFDLTIGKQTYGTSTELWTAFIAEGGFGYVNDRIKGIALKLKQ